jgi:cysteine-rich repeat protein
MRNQRTFTEEELQRLSPEDRLAYWRERTQLYNVTVVPVDGETCDDGNRVDFDGCSADCMTLDLWAPACELAVAVEARGSLMLEYEDMVYDPFRKAMVVSAADGLYSLETANENATALTAKLIVSKRFPATSLVRQPHSLVLYVRDNEHIVLYELRDGQTQLELIYNFVSLSQEEVGAVWPVIRPDPPSPLGDFVVRHRTTMEYIRLSGRAGPIVPEFCEVGEAIANETCTFMTQMGPDTMLIGCGAVRVVVGYRLVGGCVVSLGQGVDKLYDTDMEGNLWSDVFDFVSGRVSVMRVRLPFNVSASPALPIPVVSYSIQAYHPMGGFMEVNLNAPRKWATNASQGTMTAVFYYKGEAPFFDMINSANTERVCGQDRRCLFDNDILYDPLSDDIDHDRGEAKTNTIITTWNDLLQAQLDALQPPIESLYALKRDLERYLAFLHGFRTTLLARTAPIRMLAMLTHPQTGNVWVLRKDKLVEIAKTGVLLPLLLLANTTTTSSQKCMPSIVALCDPCMWAVPGTQCRSCSSSSTSVGLDDAMAARARQLLCRSCNSKNNNNNNSSSPIMRRLLSSLSLDAPQKKQAAADKDDDEVHIISFTVWAKLTATIFAIWPSTSASSFNTTYVDAGGGAVRVSVYTREPVETMRSIKARLLLLGADTTTTTDTVRVIVPPHVSVPLYIVVTDAAAGSSSSSLAIIVGCSCCLVVCLVCAFYYYYHYSTPPPPSSSSSQQDDPLLSPHAYSPL